MLTDTSLIKRDFRPLNVVLISIKLIRNYGAMRQINVTGRPNHGKFILPFETVSEILSDNRSPVIAVHSGNGLGSLQFILSDSRRLVYSSMDMDIQVFSLKC